MAWNIPSRVPKIGREMNSDATEPPGAFRTIAAGFAEQSLEERFLKPFKFPLI